MRAKKATGYICPACDTGYTTIEEAKDCCYVEERAGYECQECNTWHEERQDAMECCK